MKKLKIKCKGLTWLYDGRATSQHKQGCELITRHPECRTHTKRWFTAALKEFPAAGGQVPRDRLVTGWSQTGDNCMAHSNKNDQSQGDIANTAVPHFSSYFLSFFIYPYPLFSFFFLSFLCFFLPINNYSGCQSHPITTETTGRPQSTACGICCGQSGIRQSRTPTLHQQRCIISAIKSVLNQIHRMRTVKCTRMTCQ